MKKIVYLLIAISISSFGQRRTDGASLSQGRGGVSSTTQLGNTPLSGNKGVYGSTFWSPVVQKKENVKGSVYLLKNWFNKAVIYTNDDKTYKVSFVNFNVKGNKIDAKFDDNGNEKIFSFDSSNINKFVLKDKEFYNKLITLNDKEERKLIEKLAVRGKVRLYKSYSLFIRKGNFNPMTQSQISPNKYFNKITYYIEKDNEKLKEIKLKKSSILKLFNGKKQELKKHIKTNKLKLKNEEDFISFLNYYNSL